MHKGERSAFIEQILRARTLPEVEEAECECERWIKHSPMDMRILAACEKLDERRRQLEGPGRAGLMAGAITGATLVAALVPAIGFACAEWDVAVGMGLLIGAALGLKARMLVDGE